MNKKPQMTGNMRAHLHALALAVACASSLPVSAAALTDWPAPKSAIAKDAKLEERVAAILKQMTLA